MPIQKTYIEAQKFFKSEKTKDIAYRKEALIRFRDVLKKRENDIYHALKLDLNRSKTETYIAEYYLVMSELNHTIRNMEKWARPKRVLSSLVQLPGKVSVRPMPYGTVLIISPWNYPILLCFSPLIYAIAAGNTVILKPSFLAINSSKIIREICQEAFENGLVGVIEGDRYKHKDLLDRKYDFIFFTGNFQTGQYMMQKASEYLTPLTLELGGKSPAIVDHTADLRITAKRILFGKILNLGQTCIAPDYILVEENIKDEFISIMLEELREMIPSKEYMNEEMARIINERPFDRLVGLMEGHKLIIPQNSWITHDTIIDRENLQIYPVIIDNPPDYSRVMQEEIFGSIIPISSWRNREELNVRFQDLPKPLSLYVFTKDEKLFEYMRTIIRSGSAVLNDSVFQMTNVDAPFGGVGESGFGHYHGKYGFMTFSHEQTEYKQSFLFDIKQKYHPYDDKRYQLLKRILRR